jgi:hypothetical protein
MESMAIDLMNARPVGAHTANEIKSFQRIPPGSSTTI